MNIAEPIHHRTKPQLIWIRNVPDPWIYRFALEQSDLHKIFAHCKGRVIDDPYHENVIEAAKLKLMKHVGIYRRVNEPILRSQ